MRSSRNGLNAQDPRSSEESLFGFVDRHTASQYRWDMKKPFVSFLGLFVLLTVLTQSACGSVSKEESIHAGGDLQPVTLEHVVSHIRPGTIVVLSENHGFEPHHENQRKFLDLLAQSGLNKVSVGMEFLARTFQTSVDAYLMGHLSEAEFLQAVQWGGNRFEDYRYQVRFPFLHGGKTIALNAPRSLTSRISKVGLSGLTVEEKSMMPPGFTLGNTSYFERFVDSMQGHMPDEAVQRYFEAQSTWDETMAWVATSFLNENPDHVLMILVGDFHAAYGGGLPDRLRARGAQHVVVISQVNVTGLNDSDARDLLAPHPKWGSRADFIWAETAPTSEAEHGVKPRK